MLLPAMGAGLLLYFLLAPSQQAASPVSCRDRRRTKGPLCEEDPECEWVPGTGCVDRDRGRYFSSDALFDSEKKQDEKLKFCRCALHVMAKSDYDPKRAYIICAKSTKTTTGGRPCMYDWDRIPDDEVRGYVSVLEKRGMFKKDSSKKGIKEVRGKLKEWYQQKKSV